MKCLQNGNFTEQHLCAHNTQNNGIDLLVRLLVINYVKQNANYQSNGLLVCLNCCSPYCRLHLLQMFAQQKNSSDTTE